MGLTGSGGFTGGGGGSAFGDGCAGSPNTGADGERNDGGRGGDGVVIIRYSPCTSSTDSSTISGATVVKFLSGTNCSWSIPAGVNNIDVLAVAAGGGGASDGGTGGAGGELRYSNGYSVSGITSFSVSIGTGGIGGSWKGGSYTGVAGNDSIIKKQDGTTLFQAKGGSGGNGWTSTTAPNGGTGGTGGTGGCGRRSRGPSCVTVTRVSTSSSCLTVTSCWCIWARPLRRRHPSCGLACVR